LPELPVTLNRNGPGEWALELDGAG